ALAGFGISPGSLPHNPALGDDFFYRWQSRKYIGSGISAVSCRSFPSRNPGVAHHDPTDHTGHLMREAVVIIDAGSCQRDLETFVRQQKTTVPRRGTCRNAPLPIKDVRMIGRRRVAIAGIAIDETNSRA